MTVKIKDLAIPVAIIMLLYAPLQPISTINIQEELEVYSATLPFGVFSLKGDLHGGFIFVSGELSGSEIYCIKYLENNTLKTIILDAEKTPLIIDGTMRFIRSYTSMESKPFIDFFNIRSKSNSLYTYSVHIPFLPEYNQTTTDWVK